MSLLCGFMVPHPPIAVAEIGNGEERKIQPTLNAFDEVSRRVAKLRPDTIVLTSPHQILYNDYFHISPGKGAKGDFGSFRRPDVKMTVRYDEELAGKISSRVERVGLPAGFKGERDKRLDHGTMVPLYFINKYYTDYELVRIGLSGMSLEAHYHFGQLIRSVCNQTDKRVIFIASGDLSHCQKEDGPYGYKKEGPFYDEKLMEVMGRGALDELLSFDENLLYESQECGHRSFVIMAGAFEGEKVNAQILSHEATFGVGYGIGIFESESLGDLSDDSVCASEDPYVRLAVETIRSFVTGKDISVHSQVPTEMMTQRAGAFVSIHECGLLRGCIGTILPTCENVAEEIVQNAVSAASRDPRFAPIREDELDALEISVDVLGAPEKIESKDELDVKRYGVIVESGYKRGLLLPDLDGVDTVDEQILIAKQKAGIGYGEEISLSRFEVVRHI